MRITVEEAHRGAQLRRAQRIVNVEAQPVETKHAAAVDKGVRRLARTAQIDCLELGTPGGELRGEVVDVTRVERSRAVSSCLHLPQQLGLLIAERIRRPEGQVE